MHHFRSVPTSQQTAATNRSETQQGGGCYEMGNVIKLHGRNENEVTVQLPSYAGVQWASVDAAKDNILVFHPFGFLIKGVSQDLER
jgi:hypothetical protein